MGIIETTVLGLIQGLTEFIPISSSGHLVIAQNLLIGSSEHLFLEWINIGTLLALCVFFRHKIAAIIRGIIIKKDYRLALNIIITALPAGIVGYMLSDFIDSSPFFGSSITVVVTLASVGIIMIVLEKLPMADQTTIEKLSPFRALIIGVAQVLALIPGVSRSGSTIITGRLMGLRANMAAEYSFLASIPIMIGVTIKLFVSSADRHYFIDNASMLILGNTIAFISGLLAIGFLMKYLSTHSLAVFGWYRVGLAAILAIIILLQ